MDIKIVGRRQNEKGDPGLRQYSGVARMERDGPLGDSFFSFAVAGTRNFYIHKFEI